MSAISSSVGVSSSLTQTQLQKIMQQYGCTQAQAQQILNGQSPAQVIQGTSAATSIIPSTSSSGTSGTAKHHGHHPVTLTKTDPKTGQITSVTANSKTEVQSYEAQGYVKQDNSSGKSGLSINA